MRRNEINLRFCIHQFDDISHEDITQLLGIQPTYVKVKGQERRPNKPESPLWESNTWSFDTGIDKYADFDMHMNALLDILESKKEMLKPICEKYLCEISCGMFVYFDNGESTPWVHMDSRYNNLIKELNIEFDLDLYVLPNKKE